jgi:hypothetical protein
MVCVAFASAGRACPCFSRRCVGVHSCQRGHKQWTIRDLLLHAYNIAISPTWLCIQGRDIALWWSICSRIHILLHSVQRRDCHEPMMVVVYRDGSSMSCDGRLLVVCRSEYVVVLPPIVDWSILMCDQCVCMHLCLLYLDCVVSNKNRNVCLLPRYKFNENRNSVPLIS